MVVFIHKQPTLEGRAAIEAFLSKAQLLLTQLRAALKPLEETKLRFCEHFNEPMKMLAVEKESPLDALAKFIPVSRRRSWSNSFVVT